MHTVSDFRSDTVTRPSAEMRRAIADAEVGDDVFGDDPTINRLQEVAAARMGKEAALFVASGTMGNSIAMKVHTKPGDEVLMDGDAHSMLYEVGLPAVIANVMTRQFHSERGVPDISQIADAIQHESLHGPGTALIILENTHNRAGGAVIPLEVMDAVRAVADEHRVAVHVDGARIFNASVASGIPVREYAARADSITFCLSKGLGCPIGSVLCGTNDFVNRARRVRKMLGGGMRQAGILAAAGLYALEHNIDRLVEDHANAIRLAVAIVDAPGVLPDPYAPPTNMVYFNTTGPADAFVDALTVRGVLANATAKNRIRMVTHLDVDEEDVDRAAEAIWAVGREQ
ncbi:MAG TPA: low-specificity L-threonine aldolase [Armatimonadota bacterium]|jgi:threonine aldolase